MGAFTGVYRAATVTGWVEKAKELSIPCSDAVSLAGVMGNPAETRQWQIEGLPTDAISTDNAVMVKRGQRWPLMIDPQEQAKKWIKNREEKNNLAVTRLDNVNLLRCLENCVRVGTPLLVEDIAESIDPALESILQKATFTQGGRLLIRIGDSDVDYDPSFRFYITTKLPNPHYLPEVCIKVTIINFSITKEGLEDQLMNAVVAKERPEKAKQRDEIVVSMAADQKQLKDIENKILKLLSESTGNVLDDHELIKTLGESKIISGMVEERLEASKQTNEEIEAIRQSYLPVAVRGTLIYFIIADLASIDPMYQYSLFYCKQLFNNCIDRSEKSEDLDTRLVNIMDYLTYEVFKNICRGLFERHTSLFSLLVCVQIMRERGDIDTGDWMTLLKGAGLTVNPNPNPIPETLSEKGWNMLHVVDADEIRGEANPFRGICEEVAKNRDAWVAWASEKQPQDVTPPKFCERLTEFQQLLVLKAFREEKLVFATKSFVGDNLDERFLESPPVPMSDLYKDMSTCVPLIFILSTGADPTDELYSFATDMGYDSKFTVIALGQGQGPRAEAAIEKAGKWGEWVMLQNCHLGKSWLPKLEAIVDGFPKQELHENFRLFLTSFPATYFPVPILQNGVKLTTEPPKGIRANVGRSLVNYETWTEFETVEERVVHPWKKIAFGLAFFHGIIQERRKFGALGFNIPYEFNDTDLKASVTILRMFLEEQPVIPWQAIKYVVGEISYGGRVTDDWDQRCVGMILEMFASPEILDDAYKFSASGTYYAPKQGKLQSYKDYVASLPLLDNPEVFGLDDNAILSCELAETTSLLSEALSIQPRTAAGGGGGGKTPDEIVDDLAKVIESSLPPDLDLEEAGPTSFRIINGNMDSLGTVLMQEIARYNKLLHVMRKTLSELQMAIRGETLMSDVLDSVYVSLTNNIVPPVWAAAAFASLKPLGAWHKDLLAKLEFIHTWLLNGQPNVFWLAGLFFPQGFLTGALQNHARKYKLPIDTLNYDYEVYKQYNPEDVPEEQVPDDGVLLSGIFMDGARWDDEACVMAEQRPGELFIMIPIIHFLPAVKQKNPFAPSDMTEKYEIPVYKTSVRRGQLSTTGMSTNFVIAMEMPIDLERTPVSYWVLRGAACLTQLDD
jgi:dynein heavy chain